MVERTLNEAGRDPAPPAGPPQGFLDRTFGLAALGTTARTEVSAERAAANLKVSESTVRKTLAEREAAENAVREADQQSAFCVDIHSMTVALFVPP